MKYAVESGDIRNNYRVVLLMPTGPSRVIKEFDDSNLGKAKEEAITYCEMMQSAFGNESYEWEGVDRDFKKGWAPSPDRDELLRRIEILEARLLALGGSIE